MEAKGEDMNKRLIVCLVILSMFCLGWSAKYQKLVPARQNIPRDVKSITIQEFSGEGGQVVAEMLSTALLKPGFYEITTDPNKADAVITGSVSGYKVETARGSLILTPATYNATGNILTYATHRYWTSKSCKVGINYRISKEKKLIASKYVSKSYNSGKQYDDDPAYFQIASDEAILNDLVSDLTERVVPEFSPHYLRVRKKIYKGKSEYMKKGYKLAKKGRWEDAIFEWRTELTSNPGNRDAIHNISVARELLEAQKPKEKARYKPIYKKEGEGIVIDPLNIER